jgi:zinc transport system substrate-binding protein
MKRTARRLALLPSILLPLIVLPLVAPGLTADACAAGETTAPAAGPVLRVAAVVPPHAELARRIGGDRIAVQSLVAPGESPHTYDPTPRELTELAGATLLLRTGVPLENLLVPRLQRSFPDLEIVDLRQGLDLLRTGETDPHIWLSPRLLEKQVATIADALARLDPAGTSLYTRNRDSLVAELADLDRELTAMLAPVRGRELIVFHPAFGYFARDYGLVQVAIEEGGLAPTPSHIAEVLEKARATGARAVFVQPQHSPHAARVVARELGLELVTLDPLAPDVLANLRHMAGAILDGLAPERLNR